MYNFVWTAHYSMTISWPRIFRFSTRWTQNFALKLLYSNCEYLVRSPLFHIKYFHKFPICFSETSRKLLTTLFSEHVRRIFFCAFPLLSFFPRYLGKAVRDPILLSSGVSTVVSNTRQCSPTMGCAIGCFTSTRRFTLAITRWAASHFRNVNWHLTCSNSRPTVKFG